MSKAIEDVVAERQRQIEAEGWTPEHDDSHKDGDLAYAATAYSRHAACVLRTGATEVYDEPPGYWPWSREWWKPKDTRRDMVRAAALLIAEIERLDRAASKTPNGPHEGPSGASREGPLDAVVGPQIEAEKGHRE